MALFMLDCDSVTSTGSTLDSVAKEITNIGSSVNGYDTSCEDGFDFASAKSAIASNIEACSVKVQNASKIVSTVVSSHTSLQNQLIYGKKEEEKKTQQRKVPEVAEATTLEVAAEAATQVVEEVIPVLLQLELLNLLYQILLVMN